MNKSNKLNWDELIPKMKEMFSLGKTYTEIASELGISFSSVKRKAISLGLDYETDKNSWTEDEINKLRILLDSGKSYQELEKVFSGRHSIQSIQGIVRYRGDSLNLKYSGNTRRYITEEDISKATYLVDQGLSYKEIGKKLNRDPKSVKRELLARGKRVLTKSEKEKLGFVKGKGLIGLTEEVLQDLVGNKGIPYNIIAKQFGVNSSTVERRSKELGIIPPIGEEKEVIKSHRQELVEKFLGRELEEGERLPTIESVLSKDLVEKVYSENNYNARKSAESLEISISEFEKLRRIFNIPFPKTPTIKDYPEDFYRKLYVEDGLSYADIAEIVNLSEDTVRKYLCKTFPDAKKYGKYSSMGEKLVASVLTSMGIKFIYNKRYDNVNPLDPSRVYMIDFVFTYKKKEFWIEYNGAQHYKFVEYFYKSMDNFEKQLERDRFVSELSNNLSIPLLIIPYTVRTERGVLALIEEFLNNCVK